MFGYFYMGIRMFNKIINRYKNGKFLVSWLYVSSLFIYKCIK